MVQAVNELSCVSLFATRLEKELFHCEDDLRQVTGGDTRYLALPQGFKRLLFFSITQVEVAGVTQCLMNEYIFMRCLVLKRNNST